MLKCEVHGTSWSCSQWEIRPLIAFQLIFQTGKSLIPSSCTTGTASGLLAFPDLE